MYDERNGELFPGNNPEMEKRGEYADVWEEANMTEDAPEFQGEDPYNPNTTIDEIKETAEEKEKSESEKTSEKTSSGAKSLTSYGFDTAARIYGLDSVLKTIEETDETDRDAKNPIASIYSRLVPDPEERNNLYREIDKELTETDLDEEKDNDPNDAIRQMKLLLSALENDTRFADVRKRAASEGKDIISYITSGEVKPTLSNLFEGIEGASNQSVEEILDEIEEEEKAKQFNDVIEGKKDLDDITLNPELTKDA